MRRLRSRSDRRARNATSRVRTARTRVARSVVTPAKEIAMQSSLASRLVTRVLALCAACAVTGLVVFVHAVDLTTLGAHDLVVAAPAAVTAGNVVATTSPPVNPPPIRATSR
jgi:hypothetical protein